LGGVQATKGEPSTRLPPQEASNLFGGTTIICVISSVTGLIQLISDKLKIGETNGGLFEATVNEFFSKVRMNYSNIGEDDTLFVQDQNSGPSRI